MSELAAPGTSTMVGVAAAKHAPEAVLPPVANRTMLGMPQRPAGERPATTNPSAMASSTPPSASGSSTHSASAAAVPPKPATHATLLGVSPLLQPESPAAELKRTIVGMAAAPFPHREGAGAPGTDFVGPAMGARAIEPHRTMLGVAPVQLHQAAQPPIEADESALKTPSAFGQGEAAPRNKGTLLGVAMPGIAPLQPGHAKAAAAIPQPTNLVPMGSVLAEGARPPSATPSPSRSTAQGRLAWLFGIAAVIMVLVVAGATYLWWTAVHLTVQVTSNESGAEQLLLTCSNCPDGTVASLDSTSTHFKQSRATIELKQKLAVGINRLTLKFSRPNRASSETVSVTVPVDFRVTTSLAELTADPPAVSIRLESAPNTRFVLEGTPYQVGTSGALNVPIDVSRSLTGASPVVVPFEQRFAYEIVRDGTTTRGALVVRTGITALEVLTPGAMHITQNATFTLTGRTTPHAKLTANGHAIPIAADGSFRQEMALSAPGSTKLLVRAQESQLAPRMVEVSLERVTNLKQRANELAQPLASDFDAVMATATDKTDTLAALRGEIVAIENANALTRIAASSPCHRGSCLFSIRYGGPLALRAGNHVLAIGRARLVPRPNAPTERDLTLDAHLVVDDGSR